VRHDIELQHSERDRSAIYSDFLPMLTSGRARLIDSQRLTTQFLNLERKTAPGGKDRIDHPVGANDDCANAAAGALVLASVTSSYLPYDRWVGAPSTVEAPQMWADLPYFQRFGGLMPW
jgi:hypothetical protein